MTTVSTFMETQRLLSYPSSQQEETEFFDSTPYQANMSKRRSRFSELQQDNTLSRVKKIRDVFEEVALGHGSFSPSARRTSGQADSLGPYRPESSHKAVRLSIHKADSDYLVSSLRPQFPSALSRPQSLTSRSTKRLPCSVASSPLRSTRKPLSTGRNTPSRIPRPVRDLNIIKLGAGYTYGENSDDEDTHSTHGVPLILPIHGEESDIQQKTSDISQWLRAVKLPDSSESDEPASRNSKERIRSSPLKINSKENSPPKHGPTTNQIAKDSFAIGSTKLTLADAKMNSDRIPNVPATVFSQYTKIDNESVKKRTPPTGLLLLPPRRNGQTPATSIPLHNVNTRYTIKSLRQKPKLQRTAISRGHSVPPEQTEEDDGLVELSPSVNKDRRRRGFAKNGNSSARLATDSSSQIELADFILSLEAHDREEEEQRGRSAYTR